MGCSLAVTITAAWLAPDLPLIGTYSGVCANCNDPILTFEGLEQEKFAAEVFKRLLLTAEF